MANTFPDSPVLSASDSPPNENPPAMANQPESCPCSTTQRVTDVEEGYVLVDPPTESDAEHPSNSKNAADPSADSITEEGFVLVDPSTDSDAEHPSNCKDSADPSADSIAQAEFVLVVSSADSDDSDPEHPSNCENSADSSTCSTPRSLPDREGLVSADPSTDSDSDEILFTNPRVSAANSSDITTEQLPARPPFQRKLCHSGFCGISGIKHPIGPYLHGGNLPPKDMSELGLSSPPWDCANPPQQVWEAWIDSFPTGVGPERETSRRRTAKHQREIDLVDGFIAHHSWTPDENKFHPATRQAFKRWCEKWKSQRERGILRPRVKELYW